MRIAEKPRRDHQEEEREPHEPGEGEEERLDGAQGDEQPGAGYRARRRAGGERGGGEGQRHRERGAGHEVDEWQERS